jgi:adenylate cyclase 10
MDIIRNSLGCDEQVDPIGLLTSANLFLTLADVRFSRGQLELSLECSFLVLRLSKLLHDNGLMCHNLPTLIRSLLFQLKITDATEALNNLWFTAQADDFWIGTAWYYALTLDILLELGCPLENFYHVQQFVTGKDWDEDMTLVKERDLLFNFETSIALWYARFSKWEESADWISKAESHMSSSNTVLSIGGQLKLLQCYLIRAYFHQMKRRYSLFSLDQDQVNRVTQSLETRIKSTPVYIPRYYHLRAYHHRILNHRKRADLFLTKATLLAKQHGNRLEVEFVKHSRMVWAEMANPAVKYYWLEHVEQPVINWNAPSTVPWANILYSLPLPAWT